VADDWVKERLAELTDDGLARHEAVVRQRIAESDNVPSPYDDLMLILTVGLRERGRLLAQACKLIEPFEWADDRGRECPWCQATRTAICRTGEPPRDPRKNHRPGCRFMDFIRAVQEVGL